MYSIVNRCPRGAGVKMRGNFGAVVTSDSLVLIERNSACICFIHKWLSSLFANYQMLFEIKRELGYLKLFESMNGNGSKMIKVN